MSQTRNRGEGFGVLGSASRATGVGPGSAWRPWVLGLVFGAWTQEGIVEIQDPARLRPFRGHLGYYLALGFIRRATPRAGPRACAGPEELRDRDARAGGG